MGESTIEHDLHFMSLIERAGLSDLAVAEGETPAEFAQRVLKACSKAGAVLELLGCLLIPEDAVPTREPHTEPGRVWTPELARATRVHLGAATDETDKATVQGAILGLLIHFFESGIVSLGTSPTSSKGAVPENGKQNPGPAPSGDGPSSSARSPMGTSIVGSA